MAADVGHAGEMAVIEGLSGGWGLVEQRCGGGEWRDA